MDSGKITWFKYVPNGFVHVWEEAGWEAIHDAFNGTHHGHYSTLMQWAGEGDAVCPQKEEA
jgi:hypothetical protein